jgi:hypothetical protein
MTTIIARFIGVRHANIHWNSKEYVYMLGIQSFWSFHFESWSKIQNNQSHPICPAQDSSSILSILIKHISLIIDRMKAREYPLERGGSSRYPCYSTLVLNPITTVPVSYFLIAARCQVRFDVSTESVISWCCWQS